MKGFKPTGYGPNSGFRFPANMGFTGSTGTFTNVSPYVRRKAFADGGFVRQDTPRMKVDSIGDQGSGLVRRKRSSNALDQESGGKSPLRPGYKAGGRMRKANGGMARLVGRAMENARAAAPVAEGAAAPVAGRTAQMVARAVQNARAAPPRQYTGGGALGRALSMVAQADRAKQDPVKRIPTPGVRGRFYEKGGKVVRPTKEQQNRYTFMDSVWAIPEAIKEGMRYLGKKADPLTNNTGARLSGRQKQVDDYVDRATRGYGKGGKAKRMGYAKGGSAKKSVRDRC